MSFSSSVIATLFLLQFTLSHSIFSTSPFTHRRVEHPFPICGPAALLIFDPSGSSCNLPSIPEWPKPSLLPEPVQPKGQDWSKLLNPLSATKPTRDPPPGTPHFLPPSTMRLLPELPQLDAAQQAVLDADLQELVNKYRRPENNDPDAQVRRSPRTPRKGFGEDPGPPRPGGIHVLIEELSKGLKGGDSDEETLRGGKSVSRRIPGRNVRKRVTPREEDSDNERPLENGAALLLELAGGRASAPPRERHSGRKRQRVQRYDPDENPSLPRARKSSEEREEGGGKEKAEGGKQLKAVPDAWRCVIKGGTGWRCPREAVAGLRHCEAHLARMRERRQRRDEPAKAASENAPEKESERMLEKAAKGEGEVGEGEVARGPSKRRRSAARDEDGKRACALAPGFWKWGLRGGLEAPPSRAQSDGEGKSRILEEERRRARRKGGGKKEGEDVVKAGGRGARSKRKGGGRKGKGSEQEGSRGDEKGGSEECSGTPPAQKDLPLELELPHPGKSAKEEETEEKEPSRETPGEGDGSVLAENKAEDGGGYDPKDGVENEVKDGGEDDKRSVHAEVVKDVLEESPPEKEGVQESRSQTVSVLEPGGDEPGGNQSGDQAGQAESAGGREEGESTRVPPETAEVAEVKSTPTSPAPHVGAAAGGVVTEKKRRVRKKDDKSGVKMGEGAFTPGQEMQTKKNVKRPRKKVKAELGEGPLPALTNLPVLPRALSESDSDQEPIAGRRRLGNSPQMKAFPKASKAIRPVILEASLPVKGEGGGGAGVQPQVIVEEERGEKGPAAKKKRVRKRKAEGEGQHQPGLWSCVFVVAQIEWCLGSNSCGWLVREKELCSGCIM
jgi:hypothetical protein